MAGAAWQVEPRVTSATFIHKPGKNTSLGLRLVAAGCISSAIALSSATTLRLEGWPLGVGEGLALACIALRWANPAMRSTSSFEDFTSGGVGAFRMLLLAVLVSASFSTVAAPWLVGPVQAATGEQALRNLLALWLVCAFSEAAVTLAVGYRLRALGLAALCTTVGLHLVLLVISLVSGAPWAAAMWYQDTRFAGLAENPNQLGLSLVAAASAAAALAPGSAAGSVVAIAATIGLVVLALATRSDASLLALAVLGLLAVIVHLPSWCVYSRSDRTAAAGAGFVVLMALFALATLPLLADIASRIYDEGAQGSDRMHLWSSAFEAGLSSPVVGLGLAAHARLPGHAGAHEAHNTFLDWWAMTGALGTAVLILLLAGAGLDMKRCGNRLGLCGLAALAVFSAFHLVLRQPAFWFAIGICYAAGASRLRSLD